MSTARKLFRIKVAFSFHKGTWVLSFRHLNFKLSSRCISLELSGWMVLWRNLKNCNLIYETPITTNGEHEFQTLCIIVGTGSSVIGKST